MEISLQVAKAPEEGAQVQKEDVLMTCAFTMVNIQSLDLEKLYSFNDID